MTKKFAYVFPIGTKLVRSYDTEEMLRNRVSGEDATVVAEVNEFIQHATVGSDMSFDTGEIVFRIV